MQTVVTAVQKGLCVNYSLCLYRRWYLSLHHLACTAAGSILKKCLPASRKMRNITKPSHLYYRLRYSTDVYSSYKVQTMFWTHPSVFLFSMVVIHLMYESTAATNKDDIPKHPYSLSLSKSSISLWHKRLLCRSTHTHVKYKPPCKHQKYTLPNIHTQYRINTTTSVSENN